MQETARKTIFVTVTIAFLIVIGTVITARTTPPLVPAIWITPETFNFETATASVGDRFNVTAWIRTVGMSFVWQVRVNFNASQLEAVRAGYTSGEHSLFFEGYDTIPLTPIIDNAAGFVLHAESLIGADSAPPGSNSLFWIEFRIALEPRRARVPLTSLISISELGHTIAGSQPQWHRRGQFQDHERRLHLRRATNSNRVDVRHDHQPARGCGSYRSSRSVSRNISQRNT